MKVKIVEQSKPKVRVCTLNIGDGFIFDGDVHVVCTSLLGFDQYFKDKTYALNLFQCNMVALSDDYQVQPCDLELICIK